MIIRKVKPVEYQTIQRFANIYGFPYDDNLIEIFQNINGGIVTGFHFLYKENGVFETNIIKKILSFNPEDNDNTEEIIDVIDGDENLVPFAVTEDEDYLCYCNENDEYYIKLFRPDTEEFFDIYTEDKELYTPSMFFADLGC